jgi:hypothetical protein
LYNKGTNSWTLIGDYLLPPPLPPPIIDVAKRKKKKKKSDFSDPMTRWAVINRVNLNINCSCGHEDAGGKLDSAKEFLVRQDQAQKENFVSLDSTIALFAGVSDIWDSFEHALLILMKQDVMPGVLELDLQEPCALNSSGESLVSREPPSLRHGRDRAACV